MLRFLVINVKHVDIYVKFTYFSIGPLDNPIKKAHTVQYWYSGSTPVHSPLTQNSKGPKFKCPIPRLSHLGLGFHIISSSFNFQFSRDLSELCLTHAHRLKDRISIEARFCWKLKRPKSIFAFALNSQQVRIFVFARFHS